MPEPKIQKKNNAQAALEYLLTYGWALILIATVIGVLVFVVMTPSSTVVFSSSNPTKIMLKGGTITSSTAEIRLQNITGGNIEITSAGGCSVNREPDPSSNPVSVSAGNQIILECSAPGGEMPPVIIEYTDYAGLEREVEIRAGGTDSGTGEVTAGLVSHYEFNEGSGATAADSSGNENSGTIEGAVWKTTNCPDDKCLEFVDNDYVHADLSEAEFSSEIFSGYPFTFAAWVKPNAVQEGAIVGVSNRSEGNMSAFIEVFPYNGQFYAAQVNYFNWNFDRSIGSTSISPAGDTWYHITGVYRSATDRELYLNGSSDGTDTTSKPFVPNLDTTMVGILYRPALASDFAGFIDEAKIYNRALSDSEICILCNEHKPAGVTCNCTP